MEQSSFCDEQTIKHQFDSFCKKVLKGEAIDYQRHMMYRQKYEILLSELSERELGDVFIMDEYNVENSNFNVLGYQIEVKDSELACALRELSEKKRNVILLSFFMDMSDAEIAREMNVVRSTIHEHRTRSIELLKQIMRKSSDEKSI